MSGLFDQKKQNTEVSVAADPYKSVREPYLNWLSGQIGKPGPTYTGEMVAPLSKQQDQSLSWLDQYASGGPASTRTAAEGEINKTLSGAYSDPTTSPYYQAVKAEAARNLKDTQRNIASNAAGGGNYWTGARLGVQGKEASNTANSLNQTLGTMALQERQNMLNTIPQALNAATQTETAPLQKATALQSLGALPQTQQQAIDTALQQMWQQSQYQYPMSIAQIAQGTQQAPVYAQTGYAPSTAQQLAPWLGLAAQAAMFAANPAAGAASAGAKAASGGLNWLNSGAYSNYM